MVGTEELVYDDNRSIIGDRVKVVPAEELSRREASIRKVIDEPATDRLIKKHKKDGTTKSIDALLVLAWCKEKDVVLSPDLVDALAAAIHKAKELRKNTRTLKDGGDKRGRRWRAAADEMKRHNRALSDNGAANLLAAKPGETASARTIRRALRKFKNNFGRVVSLAKMGVPLLGTRSFRNPPAVRPPAGHGHRAAQGHGITDRHVDPNHPAPAASPGLPNYR